MHMYVMAITITKQYGGTLVSFASNLEHTQVLAIITLFQYLSYYQLIDLWFMMAPRSR